MIAKTTPSLFLALAAALAALSSGFAQEPAVEEATIEGLWTDGEERAHILVQIIDDELVGTIQLIHDETRILDENNPDEELRDRELVGLRILEGFSLRDNGKWEGGTVYDSAKGKTYKGKVWLNDDGTVGMRGFIGVSLLGRTDTWTRVVEEEAAE